jgi:hypothetical protein
MPKSYSQYRFEDLNALGLILIAEPILLNIAPVSASDLLTQLLKINTISILTTEKAKSEFIIAPILYEIARLNHDKVSFFSGHNMDVDKELGLKGFCDFLYSKTPKTPIVKSPIFCIAEAKNDNLERGMPQCIAEMFAARMFNERHKTPTAHIYGCVTTGYNWQFLKLDGQNVLQDTTIYTLQDLPKILGILQFIVEQ